MLPYLCEASGAFFCVDCSVAEVVVADAEREEMRPVRYARHALENIRQAEDAVTSALEGVAAEAGRTRASRVDLTPLNAAVEEAAAVGAAASAVSSAQMRQRQMGAATDLEAAMEELDGQRCEFDTPPPCPTQRFHRALLPRRHSSPLLRRSQANGVLEKMEHGKRIGVSEDLLGRAAALVRACYAESGVSAATIVCKVPWRAASSTPGPVLPRPSALTSPPWPQSMNPATPANEQEVQRLEGALTLLRRLDPQSSLLNPGSDLLRKRKAEVRVTVGAAPTLQEVCGSPVAVP